MKKSILIVWALFISWAGNAGGVMTPELLWKLGRVSAVGLTRDGQSVVFNVITYDTAENISVAKQYLIPVTGGKAVEITGGESLVADHNMSPTGKYRITVEQIKIKKIFGKDYYPALDRSEVMIYDDLMYRHWDTWADGKFNHIILHRDHEKNGIDIMEGEPYDCPLKPFGGSGDYTWDPEGKKIIYASKKLYGKAYTLSTNTDLYEYDMATGKTTNLTKGMPGYDTHPRFSPGGKLAWLSMKRDGYEADKNDIIVRDQGRQTNLTKQWDGTVISFIWKKDGSGIYFNAAVDGTIQLFEVDDPGLSRKPPVVKQITRGDFDIRGLTGISGSYLVVSRTDMNHAAELFSIDLTDGSMKQITHVNDTTYHSIDLSKIERRYFRTTDGRKMLVWVIYPPRFDPSKKYPTLLYCQGGPQSPLSQFYSFRWNFQVMAAQGYIIVAPSRRGMPGFGVEWNEAVSKDYGGQPIRDYLTAIDEMAREKYVDNERIGAVGASFGGYSVFFLAGNHDKRFKTFIAHDGIFDMVSMYGTTDELFFVNWDNGGPYWDKNNKAAMKTYTDFNPLNYVNNWDTPILIIQGGRDYRVPDGQAFEAFQAARLKGIRSRLLYFPYENHWVLKPQNGLVWQREFFRWLRETL